MFDLPIVEKLNNCRNVLIAGAGGGYDVFTGLPLYFALKGQGKKVHLANWTFTDIPDSGERAPQRLSPFLSAVNADSQGPREYFPELYLCKWFRARGENVSIYCFDQCGTQQLKRCYEILLKELGLDSIVLIDGGTDSLLRGEEETLGTPGEDMTSIAAVDQLDLPTKILGCIGFGIDTFHGVCHAHVLDSIAEQAKKEGFLGAMSLLKSMPEVKQFASAASYVFRSMPEATSIVVSSILSALDGQFGDYHVTDRTHGSELFINPLMSFYWFFDLRSVADSIVYMNEVRAAEEYIEVLRAIKCHPRKDGVIRRWKSIPL